MDLFSWQHFRKRLQQLSRSMQNSHSQKIMVMIQSLLCNDKAFLHLPPLILSIYHSCTLPKQINPYQLPQQSRQQQQQQKQQSKAVDPKPPKYHIYQHYQPYEQRLQAENSRFKFSYMHSKIWRSEERNLIKGQQLFGFGLCEPAIQKIGQVGISFKIRLNQGYVYVGLCQKELLSSVNYGPNLQDVGHGCYLICSDGTCYSHHLPLQDIKNNKIQSFKFVDNDVISIEVKGKYITWTKQSQPMSPFVMQLNIPGDLHFCIGLYGYYGEAEIVK